MYGIAQMPYFTYVGWVQCEIQNLDTEVLQWINRKTNCVDLRGKIFAIKGRMEYDFLDQFTLFPGTVDMRQN